MHQSNTIDTRGDTTETKRSRLHTIDNKSSREILVMLFKRK